MIGSYVWFVLILHSFSHPSLLWLTLTSDWLMLYKTHFHTWASSIHSHFPRYPTVNYLLQRPESRLISSFDFFVSFILISSQKFCLESSVLFLIYTEQDSCILKSAKLAHPSLHLTTSLFHFPTPVFPWTHLRPCQLTSSPFNFVNLISSIKQVIFSFRFVHFPFRTFQKCRLSTSFNEISIQFYSSLKYLDLDAIPSSAMTPSHNYRTGYRPVKYPLNYPS